MRWDRPAYYGVACKREDCRTRKSAFNVKGQCLEAFRAIVRAANAKLIVVSFNDEGYLGREQIEQSLGERGEVFVLTRDFKRYVGAQIGIYDPLGRKVGKVGRLRNREFIYVVATERASFGRPVASILGDLDGGTPSQCGTEPADAACSDRVGSSVT